LIGFARGSETENGFFSIPTNAAKRRQFAHLVAVWNQIQERTNALFLKVAVQSANINTLPSIHKLQDPQDVGEELAFVDQQHVRRFQFFRASGFQLLNGRAHDAGDHGAVMRGKQRIFGGSVAGVAGKIHDNHAHVAKCALFVQVGEPRGFP